MADSAIAGSVDRIPIRRALIAVSDKRGLVELASSLVDSGIEIVSTGGTSAAIAAAGLPVTQVATVTGYPEHLDGRVRTLHPNIHSGVLADRRRDSHMSELVELGIKPFELVVVNLYPFTETVAAGGALNEVIEQIDIGGPALLRAAAKNFVNVAVVVAPERYPELIEAVQAGGTTIEQRNNYALAAFRHTAEYDIAVADWFSRAKSQMKSQSTASHEPFPEWYASSWVKAAELRYGENPHQRAAVYLSKSAPLSIAQASQLNGKEMSYNNYVDADAAVRTVYDFAEPAVAIVKHANPCGIAIAADSAVDSIADAYLRAHAGDPVSAFGGVVAANREVTTEMAAALVEVFTEVLVAPGFEPGALQLLKQKKNLRLLKLGEFVNAELPSTESESPGSGSSTNSGNPITDSGRMGLALELKQITGGLLIQEPDQWFSSASSWQLVAGGEADSATVADLEFAWRACRSVKSNAILLASARAAVGIGMGQVNRVDSCRLAVERAGGRAAGAVAASDAFFPFADGLQILIQAGVKAVVQPGGSVRDAEVIAAAKQAAVTMYFTSERHFNH